MNCKNKELEQEFLVEVTRVLKRETEFPSYYDLDVNEYNSGYISIRLYNYVDDHSRRVFFAVDLRKSADEYTIEIGEFGRISISISDDQAIELLYLMNVLKNAYIDKSLNNLKRK